LRDIGSGIHFREPGGLEYDAAMAVSEETLARAQRFDRSAAEAVLADSYAAVHRIARGLTGREGPAKQVVAGVLTRSLRVLPSWRKGVSPENWFYHHTVLTSRAAAANGDSPGAREDLLLAGLEEPPAEYLAFITALRKLPAQQREAFILHHGERLNDRLLGVAMDCSTGAARTHLQAATENLDTVTGGRAAESGVLLGRAYARLGPTEQSVLPYVRGRVRAELWRRRWRRFVRRVIMLAVLGGLAWAGWHWRARLVEWYVMLKQKT
jgi:DNA-directed RNA polymerase specialized sigma24 family protein